MKKQQVITYKGTNVYTGNGTAEGLYWAADDLNIYRPAGTWNDALKFAAAVEGRIEEEGGGPEDPVTITLCACADGNYFTRKQADTNAEWVEDAAAELLACEYEQGDMELQIWESADQPDGGFYLTLGRYKEFYFNEDRILQRAWRIARDLGDEAALRILDQYQE